MVKQEIDYRLEDQIGFIMRRAYQRHTGIFASLMPEDLTPTRFAVLAKLLEMGTLSQNELGRQTAMDIATIKGVVDRLRTRGLVVSDQDVNDGRRRKISLTPKGRDIVVASLPVAKRITETTMADLSNSERASLLKILKKIS